MSFLAPLFLAGGLAIGLPVLFHLIRRTTRERTVFSSLMFLQPTPPRVTRRSKLEDILLLILRCIVLCLLALAFSRPFVQKPMDADKPAGPGRRIVLLLDTSASMRRGGLWSDARAKAEDILRKTSPADQVAVFTFDRSVNRLLTFDQWNETAAGERAALASKRIADLAPGWASTQLGNALVTAAEALEESKDKLEVVRRQVVLVSDLQEGSRLDTLQSYEWPKGVELSVEPVRARRVTNAGLQLIADTEESEQKSTTPVVRVRVANAPDSKREQFQVGWVRPDAKGFLGPPLDAYVPPGQSRIVSLPAPAPGTVADRVMLQGDDEDFDNIAFVIPPEPVRVNVLYLGAEGELDSKMPLFFLKHAFQETRRLSVQVVARGPEAQLLPTDVANTPVVVATSALPDDRIETVKRLVADGRTLLFAMRDAASAATLGKVLNLDALPAVEARVANYALLSELDFQHPLFAPFADPRFSDFTKIHFWKHRRLDVTRLPSSMRVLARFDDTDPAIIEVPAGRGRVLAFTACWHTDDSQLALSTKFVPLLYSLLEQSGGLATQPAQFIVGNDVPLVFAGTDTNSAVTVIKPDGTRQSVARGEAAFAQADMPGLYSIAGSAKRFAVNLDPAESRTAPLPLDELSRLGVALPRAGGDAAAAAAQKRQLQNTEIEGRQKLWRWFVTTALALLLVETWLAAWSTRRMAQGVEREATAS
jgi:hypothetical protein